MVTRVVVVKYLSRSLVLVAAPFAWWRRVILSLLSRHPRTAPSITGGCAACYPEDNKTGGGGPLRRRQTFVLSSQTAASLRRRMTARNDERRPAEKAPLLRRVHHPSAPSGWRTWSARLSAGREVTPSTVPFAEVRAAPEASNRSQWEHSRAVNDLSAQELRLGNSRERVLNNRITVTQPRRGSSGACSDVGFCVPYSSMREDCLLEVI